MTKTKSIISLLLLLNLAGCGSSTKSGLVAAGQTARSCITETASKPQFNSLKLHTNIEHPELINAEMLSDKNYATTEESVAMKELHDEYEPCKIKFIASYTDIAPDLQLVFIKTELKTIQNRNNLINKKITWGKYNQNVVQNIGDFLRDSKPILQRIEAKIILEERQAAIARQQAIHAMSILANTAITLNAISEANRPIYTTCTSGGYGNYNCISR